MVCSQCQKPLHPYDLQRLYVPSDGGSMMVERIFCEPCAAAMHRKLVAAPAPGPQGTREPDWYRLLLTG